MFLTLPTVLWGTITAGVIVGLQTVNSGQSPPLGFLTLSPNLLLYHKAA